MEVFKDLVKFNRYKSVESFNNAKDITSSTISIVKLDENVMDIYLGRTKITHSDLLKANIELKKLIDSFDVKLKEIESNVIKSKKRVDNIDINQNSQSQSIFDIKNEIKSLHSEDNHIREILDEISKKLSKLKDSDTIPSFSDIVIIKQNIENVSKELLDKIKNNISKINTLEVKDNKLINDINELKKEILSLHSEDIHIWNVLNGLKSVSETIMSDIKENNENINNEILILKEKIKHLTGANVDNFVTLEEADKRLDKAEKRLRNLEKSDESFQSKVVDIDFNINSIKENVKKLQSFESTTNEKIKSLKEQIEELSGLDLDYFNEKINDIKEKLDGLSSTDKELQTNTNALIDIVNEIREAYTTKEYVDGKVDGKFDAAGSAIQALADAKADAANLYQVKGNYEVAGTAASLNAVMDERVTELEKINHNDYVTEEKLASKGYLTSDVADKKYAPIDTTGSGESIDLSKYAEIEYVNNNFDAAGSAAAAEISAKAYADSLATNYDAYGSAAQALNDAKADAASLYQVKGDYEVAGTAEGLDAAMDARVKVLEEIDHSVYLTEHQDISGKQDAIADLEDIRANATLAKTALQSIPEEYITEEELEAKGYITSVNMDGKQDVISDLEEIRSNAELAKTALQSVPEEYVTNEELTNQGYAKKSDIPKLEWLIFD